MNWTVTSHRSAMDLLTIDGEKRQWHRIFDLKLDDSNQRWIEQIDVAFFHFTIKLIHIIPADFLSWSQLFCRMMLLASPATVQQMQGESRGQYLPCQSARLGLVFSRKVLVEFDVFPHNYRYVVCFVRSCLRRQASPKSRDDDLCRLTSLLISSSLDFDVFIARF